VQSCSCRDVTHTGAVPRPVAFRENYKLQAGCESWITTGARFYKPSRVLEQLILRNELVFFKVRGY